MKRALIIAAALLILLAALVLWENFSLSVEQVTIPIDGLPAEFDRFRVVQVSDLHGRGIDPLGREVRAIREAGPDIIVVTGDFVEHDAATVHATLPFLRALVSLAPVYAVSGNHDHWTDWPYIAGQLREAGITVLENEHVVLDRDGAGVVLAGVNDPYTGHDDLERALPDAPDQVVVLLAHAPTWFLPEYGAELPVRAEAARNRELLEKVSLTLAGHTHGGQIKLPFLGALTDASNRFLPRSHVEGLSREEHGGWLYINRGLGHVFLPVRFLARAEVTVITLRCP